ncbi:MAG: hypothetical protein ABH829_03260 [archaeon]
MKRKIIRFGQSSHVISLPIDWMRKKRLSKSDYVDIAEMPDGALRVGTEKREERKQYELSYPGPMLVKPLVISAYINGADRIRIISDKPFTREDSRAIWDIITLLSGMEIVNESSNMVEFKCYLSPPDASMMSELKRMYRLCHEMIEDVSKSFRDKSITDSLLERTTTIERIRFLICRQAAAHGGGAEAGGCEDMRPKVLVAMALQNISHSVGHIAKVLAQSKNVLSKKSYEEISATGGAIYTLLEDAFKAFANQDIGLAIESYKRADEYMSKPIGVVTDILSRKESDAATATKIMGSAEDIVRQCKFIAYYAIDSGVMRAMTPISAQPSDTEESQ